MITAGIAAQVYHISVSAHQHLIDHEQQSYQPSRAAPKIPCTIPTPQTAVPNMYEDKSFFDMDSSSDDESVVHRVKSILSRSPRSRKSRTSQGSTEMQPVRLSKEMNPSQSDSSQKQIARSRSMSCFNDGSHHPDCRLQLADHADKALPPVPGMNDTRPVLRQQNHGNGVPVSLNRHYPQTIPGFPGFSQRYRDRWAPHPCVLQPKMNVSEREGTWLKKQTLRIREEEQKDKKSKRSFTWRI